MDFQCVNLYLFYHVVSPVFLPIQYTVCLVDYRNTHIFFIGKIRNCFPAFTRSMYYFKASVSTLGQYIDIEKQRRTLSIRIMMVLPHSSQANPIINSQILNPNPCLEVLYNRVGGEWDRHIKFFVFNVLYHGKNEF